MHSTLKQSCLYMMLELEVLAGIQYLVIERAPVDCVAGQGRGGELAFPIPCQYSPYLPDTPDTLLQCTAQKTMCPIRHYIAVTFFVTTQCVVTNYATVLRQYWQ